jgi:hypothetical protein
MRELHANLLHWNTMAAANPELPLLPPQPRATVTSDRVAQLNSLFEVAFHACSPVPIVPALHGSGASAAAEIAHRQVRIYLRRPGDDPFVIGTILNDAGWILTVAHPFSGSSGSTEHLYVTGAHLTGAKTPSVVYAPGPDNVALLHVDLDDATAVMGSPRFAHASKGDSIWVTAEDTVVPRTVEEVSRKLRLGSETIYGNSLVTAAIPAGEPFISGVPAIADDGAIVALFYHRSADHRHSGFVEMRGLPALMGHALQQEYLY